MKRPRTTSPSPDAVSKRSNSASHLPSDEEPKQKLTVNGNGNRKQTAPSRGQLDKEQVKNAGERETETPETANRRKERTNRRKGDGQLYHNPSSTIFTYLHTDQNPSMKMDPRPRPQHPNPRLPNQVLIPQLHKSPHQHGRQLASLVDLQLVVVVLDEINTRRIGIQTATEIPAT